MLPIIRATIATKGKTTIKNAAVNKLSDSASSGKRTNADRVKGLYNKLKSSNAGAHAAAIAKNDENGFERKALTLLSSINGNTEELIGRLTDDKKKSGLLGALLGGLGLLLTPYMSSLGKGLALIASPFKAMTKGISFIGKKLIELFKFLKLGKLASIAGSSVGKVVGGAVKASGAARVAGSVGAGALLGKITSKTSVKALSKGAAKMGSKLVPGVGLAVGAGFAAKRAADGDYIGALGEAASGIASTVPGIGTAAALAIQSGLIARDMSNKANSNSEKTIRSMRKGVEAVNQNAITTTQKQRTSFDSFTANLSEMTTKTKDKLLDGTDKMLSSIKDFMPKMFDNIGSGVTSLIKSLGDYGPKIMDTIKNSVAAVVSFASSPLTAVINKIKSMLPSWMGGDDSELPASTTQPTERARKNFGNVRNHLKNAAGKFGVDAGLLAKIAYFESGKSFSTTAAPVSSNASRNTVYNKGAGRKAMSSAHGLGQFTDATWYSTLKRHGDAMGIGSNLSKAKMDSYRKSPHVQAMALAALTRDNMARSANLSGGDRAADVYVLHNLGSGKGPKFLRQLRENPNASVRTVLSSKEISNNPSLYGDGSISMQEAYMKMRVHINEGQEFATAINTGATPTPVSKQQSKPNKVQKSVNVAGGVLKAVSPIGLGEALMKKYKSNNANTTGSLTNYTLKMPGTSFAPLSNNVTPKSNKKPTPAQIKERMKIDENSPRSAGTVLMPGIGNVVKQAPKVISSIPSVVRSIPSAASGVYNVITGNNSKPQTKMRDMNGNGVRVKRTDMNGAGVLKTSKSPAKSKSSSSAVYSTAPHYETDMGMNGYTVPRATMSGGDKIAASAERMIRGQTNSSFGLCARAVWFILGGAGIPGFPVTKSKSNNANDWGASGIARARDAVGPLVQRGFREIATQSAPQNGDVDVLGPRISAGANHAGHIQVFANGKWYSDHVQSRRYTTDKYSWVKTFRYGADAATGELSGANSEPMMPGNEPEMSMPEKIAHMMSSVFTSDHLNGLKEFIKPGTPDAPKPVTDRPSILPAYTGPQESVYRDFGLGPNMNGTTPDNLKRVLKGSKDRQWGDTTGIRETTGFKGSKERQWPDTTGIRETTGFKGSDNRQWGDTTGIAGTPGFNGSRSRQGASHKDKWWERLFGGVFGNILEGVFPGFGGLFDLIKNKDYASILGTVTGIPSLGKIAKAIEDKNYEGAIGEILNSEQIIGKNGTFESIPGNGTIYSDNGSFGSINGIFGPTNPIGNSDNGSFGSINGIFGPTNPMGNSSNRSINGIFGPTNPLGNSGNGSINGIFGPTNPLGRISKLTKAIESNDYSSIIADAASNSQLKGIYSNFKSKSQSNTRNGVLPSDKFITDSLSKIADMNLDNKIKLQSKHADASIITPPAQSNTVSSGSSDGAVIPISVRNNDSIIREIAKEYLRNSL